MALDIVTEMGHEDVQHEVDQARITTSDRMLTDDRDRDRVRVNHCYKIGILDALIVIGHCYVNSNSNFATYAWW